MTKRILHLHSSFSLGGKEARATRLMNLFGNSATHSILSAVPDAMGARDAIDPCVHVSFPGDAAPALHGKPGLSRYRELAAYFTKFDLILSYNWGSMDGVMAHRMAKMGLLGAGPAGWRGADLPPLIHHEDGFNADEREKLNWKRNWFRRLALGTASKLVVPSRTLEGIARKVWHQPGHRVQRIGNGIPLAAYQSTPKPDAIPGFVRKPGDIIVGTIAGLRPVKNLGMLVQALHHVPPFVRLIIVGEGPEHDSLVALAKEMGVADRLLLPGFLRNPHDYVGHFDIFALTSHSEQFPIALVEAMAAARPVVSTRVGDVGHMVSEANRPHITPAGDLALFARALNALACDSGLRSDLGIANQAKAFAEFDEAHMVSAYAALYGLPQPLA
jgi:glycosyltransferase involved in cell wall biosynthesis